MRSRLVVAVVLAAIFAGAGAATYAVSFGSAWGRDADARVFDRLSRRDAGELRQFGRRFGRDSLNLAAALGVAGVGALLAILSLAGKTRVSGWVIATLVGGAFATTQFLKSQLGNWGRDLAPDRIATDAFPSGHATLAMAIVLAAAMALPSSLRVLANVLGATVATLLGLLIVVGGLHPPSDVVGGYFVAATWAALLTPFIRRPQSRSPGSASHRLLSSLTIGASALATLIFAVAAGSYVENAFGLHRILPAVVAALLAVSTLIVVAVGMVADLEEQPLGKQARRPVET